jgi:hypothetical protein
LVKAPSDKTKKDPGNIRDFYFRMPAKQCPSRNHSRQGQVAEGLGSLDYKSEAFAVLLVFFSLLVKRRLCLGQPNHYHNHDHTNSLPPVMMTVQELLAWGLVICLMLGICFGPLVEAVEHILPRVLAVEDAGNGVMDALFGQGMKKQVRSTGDITLISY